MIGNENSTRKIASLLRRLSSPSDGEVVAAVRALLRTLETAGSDIHALADQIEKPNGNGFDEAKATKIWTAAYAQGVQDTENRQHGSDDFLGTDGKPTWQAVALFLQRNKERLGPRCHEFIDKMAALTAWGDEREPTERQHKYMHSLFFQLGGKLI
jgi:hypothetical protein